MPIIVRASFDWREDDEQFVSHLVDELRDVASAVSHRRHANRLQTKVLHQLELRVAPVAADGCMGLLAGLAEAGARVTIELRPMETD